MDNAKKLFDANRKLKKVLLIAEKLKLTVMFGDELDYSYNKKIKQSIITLDHHSLTGGTYGMLTSARGLEEAAIELSHELGHYLVASIRQRKQNDYGFSLDTRVKHSSPKKKRGYVLEVKAQMVQLEIAKFAGLNKFNIASEYKYILKQWWNYEGKAISKFAIDLVR